MCTVIAQSLLSNTCDLFSKIFEVFNEMEMEINVINKEIFTKLYIVKNKSKRKRNFIIYHFPVKSKPHEHSSDLPFLKEGVNFDYLQF